MITKWKLFNFKSIQKETELVFAPLTIFAGANSSGKSTIIQSILMVAQTLAHKVSSRSVVLNGALTKLGQFDDLRSIDSEAEQIVIGWTCKPSIDPKASRSRTIGFRRWPLYYGPSRRSLSSVSCEFSFEVDTTSTQREVAQIQPKLFSTQLSVNFRDRTGIDNRFSMVVRQTDKEDESKQRWMNAETDDEPIARSSLFYNVDIDDTTLNEIREDFASAEPVGCVLRHFLPERLTLGVNMAEEDARLIFEILVGEGRRVLPRRYHPDREILVPIEIVEYLRDMATQSGIDLKSRFSFENQMKLFDEPYSGIPLDDLQSMLHRLNPPERMKVKGFLQNTEDFSDKVLKAVRKQRKQELAIIPFRLPGALTEACWYLDQFFSTSVRYLARVSYLSRRHAISFVVSMSYSGTLLTLKEYFSLRRALKWTSIVSEHPIPC